MNCCSCPLLLPFCSPTAAAAAAAATLQELVQQEMASVYGADNIAAVVMVHDSAALDAAAAQFCTLQEKLEDVLDWYQVNLPPQEPGGSDLEAPRQPLLQQHPHSAKKKAAKLKRKTVRTCCDGCAANACMRIPVIHVVCAAFSLGVTAAAMHTTFGLYTLNPACDMPGLLAKQ